MKNVITFYAFCFFLIVGAVSCNPEEEGMDVLKASFSFQPDEIQVGNVVSFIDESIGTNENAEFLWDFGDGNTSKVKNPSHTYTQIGEGTYEVTLTIKNGNTEAVAKEKLKVSLDNTITGRKSLTEKLADGKILTCAHRANSEVAPENSMKGINDAISEEIEMVEIDIRQTKDGELVLMHDATIDRTTNGSGNVSSYSLQELKEFKLYDNNGLLTNEKIPSLKEVLALTRGELYIDLDISKKASFEAVYPIVKQYGMLKQVLFYSSNLDVIKTMINKDPEVVAMPIIDGDDRFSDYENLNNIKVVHYTNDSFNQTLVDKAKAKGWYIFMNAYVNTTTTPDDDNYGQVNKVSALAGNIIQTDHAVLVKKHLK